MARSQVSNGQASGGPDRHHAFRRFTPSRRTQAQYEVLDEIDWPARQLVDDRWVWLPTVLAGRVFTHRLGLGEAAHGMLSVTPDVDPITALCEYEE